MRRSCAPSMRKAKAAEERMKLDRLFEDKGIYREINSTTGNNLKPWCPQTPNDEKGAKENKSSFNEKLIYNVVWREMTKKKHKTWDGDGLLEVQLAPQRAVMKDSTGKYMGTCTKFNLENLQEGFQLMVGGKEVELLERITDKNEYFAIRKRQTFSLSWEEDFEAIETKKLKLTNSPPKACSSTRNGDQLQETPCSSRVNKHQKDAQKTSCSTIVSEGDKVIFNVVWRNVTAKKNKCWEGDGTLEFIPSCGRAILKNEMRQAMGCLEYVKIDELVPHELFSIGNKEFTLLEPVTTEPFQVKFVSETNTNSMLKIQHRKSKFALDDDISTLILPEPPAEFMNELNSTARPIEIVQVSTKLTKYLRPHQRDGVAFLYSCVMGYNNPAYRGCILADEMGLGKTLQCITLAHTLLRHGPYGGERVLQRVLIVTPSSLTVNWEKEINKWLRGERMYAYVVSNKNKLSTYTQQHHEPFVIASYENLLSNIVEFQRFKFDLLLCDEGHRLKNRSTKIVSALCDLNVPYRIILTGTPVQNDLQEFFSLADFVNPGIFGNYQEFRRYYEIPLQQNQNADATEEVKELAALRAQELKNISDQFMLRRLQEVNCQYLPKKFEYICFLQPSELQQFMLQKTLDFYEKRRETILKDLTPLQIITVLQKICNHPSLVAHTKKPNLLTRNLERFLPSWSDMGPFDSAKLELVHHFLVTTANQRCEKCVLVSNHTKTLNMLQGLCDFLQLQSLRVDGTMSTAERSANVEKFNADSNEVLVFLLSAKAGGAGLNLIGASRIILYDNDWNPAIDAQAMSRIWRDGQQNNVQIYRLITAGCIEEKIFQRQVAKLSLGDCVVQSAASRNATLKFSEEELLDLFTLQTDFSNCQTHESLNCTCAGDGQNLLNAVEEQKCGRQINELMQWQHYQRPFDNDFLQDACLDNAGENLLYIFANQLILN